MTPILFNQALRSGFDRLAAWSDLLDAINVFPVADGDTGRNLQVSLMPLQSYRPEDDADRLAAQLLRAARGNSGNIATQFFSEFIKTPSTPMDEAARQGARAAYRAVGDPREGTMLTLFDALAAELAQHAPMEEDGATSALLESLQTTVQNSREALPRLNAAGVVDAGALGMYLFFEGFFYALINRIDDCRPPTRRFPDSLKINAAFHGPDDQGYCVDTVLQTRSDIDTVMHQLADSAESVVTISRDDMIKLHFHTADREATRRTLEASGTLVSWSEDDLARQVQAFRQRPRPTRVHIATDGAASLTRADKQQYGFTLLDSYINTVEGSLPETRIAAEDLYRRLRAGERVTTAQASDFERRQHYQRLLETHPATLYLCVGSAFTGNYEAAVMWQSRNDPQNRLRIIDTGAASGRLAVMVLAAARLVAQGADMDAVVALAERSLTACREYIFIDRLKYLAAGGRLSRPSALVADLLHIKPVVSPLATGAEKIGSVKNEAEQLQFALHHLKVDLAEAVSPLILVEYTDNRDWVEAKAAEAISKQFPAVEIIVQPLSLTTGTHTGPGTWAVAVHPDPGNRMDLSVAKSSLASAGRPAHAERNLG
jgi:DegV family protein with EDD domain